MLYFIFYDKAIKKVNHLRYDHILLLLLLLYKTAKAGKNVSAGTSSQL